MTLRERVLKALHFQRVDRAPRDLWVQPGIEKSRPDELAEMLYRYPSDLERVDYKYPRGARAKGKPYEAGQYTDAWGCTWRVTQPGTVGEPTEPLLDSAGEMAKYEPPAELLDASRVAKVNRACAGSSRFALAWSETRPLDRLRFLRGSQVALADLVRGESKTRNLLGTLHEFCCQDLELWAATDVDGVVLMDDWGTQGGPLAPAKLLRDVFVPLYRKYCEILHAKDKFVFFHSDGNIQDLFGELLAVGFDAVHVQLFSMDLEKLAQEYRGKVAFWGEIDRLQVLPHGTTGDVRAAVQCVRRALDNGQGGVIAQCQWMVGTPFNSIAAVFDEWLHPSPFLNDGQAAGAPAAKAAKGNEPEKRKEKEKDKEKRKSR